MLSVIPVVLHDISCSYVLLYNNDNVPCMVSRPSNCHIVTMGTLWNMQDNVHVGHNDKPGTQLTLRHCGLEYTSS